MEAAETASNLRKQDIKVNQYGTPEEMKSHIRHALSLGLPQLAPALCANDGTFVVVGSGPSLPDFVDEIKGEIEKGRPICAVNGAYDFLMEKGIEPTFFLSIDPRPNIAKHLTRLSENVIYMVASRCHPKVFEALNGQNIILWHSMAIEEENEAFAPGTLLVGGCSTSGFRALNVGYYLGFRKFILYGIDSCLAKDGLTKRFDGSRAGQTVEYRVGCIGKDGKPAVGERVFKANMAMGNQAAEFNHLYRMMPGATIEAKGDGLIAAMIEQRKAMGLPT